MTDEEAIKRIRLLQLDECNCEECQKDKEAYEIVLNLIEKQDKRIKELKKAAEYWRKEVERMLGIR